MAVETYTPLISEVMQKVSNAKTKKEKIELLQKHSSQALRSILIWNYDDSVESLIPEGEVPYTPNEAPIGTEHTTLNQEYVRLYNFVKGGNNEIKQIERENMFIRMLEGLHQDEAALLCLVKDKDLQKKYKITKACVQEAFPQIQWGNRS
jgi:hypothetical protein